jgi:hypothetical protein
MLDHLYLLSLMRMRAEDFIRYSEKFSTTPAFDALSSIPSRGPYPDARQPGWHTTATVPIKMSIMATLAGETVRISCDVPQPRKWDDSMPAVGMRQRATIEAYGAVSATEVSTVVQVVAVPAGIVPNGSVST